MLELSGGSAPEGVQHETTSLDEQEAAAIDRWVKELVMRQKRRSTEDRTAVSG
jgi:hypothetical protein